MIEGTIVNLRARDVSDVDRIVRWINDREVTRHLNARYLYSRLYEEEWVRAGASAMQSFTNVQFAIETKDGVHIGNMGFHVVSPEDRNAHLGMMIGEKAYWSRGYGTDALMTMLRFAFDEMNLHRVDLSVDASNARGIACYRKCGFVEEGRMRDARYGGGGYEDQLIMGVLREEFEAIREGRRPLTNICSTCTIGLHL